MNPQGRDPQRFKRSDKHSINKLDYSSIESPASIKQCDKIEKQNSIKVNVFGYEEKQFFPICASKEKYANILNLSLVTEGEKKHYVLIKDFNSFMYDKTKHEARKCLCMHCL